MGRKRKWDAESVLDAAASAASDGVNKQEGEFKGFDSGEDMDLEDATGDIDDAFGLDSDEESEVESDRDDDKERVTEDGAEEQLQEELRDDAEASERLRKPGRKDGKT